MPSSVFALVSSVRIIFTPGGLRKSSPAPGVCQSTHLLSMELDGCVPIQDRHGPKPSEYNMSADDQLRDPLGSRTNRA